MKNVNHSIHPLRMSTIQRSLMLGRRVIVTLNDEVVVRDRLILISRPEQAHGAMGLYFEKSAPITVNRGSNYKIQIDDEQRD